MDQHLRWPCAGRGVLALLAALYAPLAYNIAGHAWLRAAPLAVETGPTPVARSDVPTGKGPLLPARSPIHEESDCPLCLSGAGSFTLGPTQAGPLTSPDVALAPRPGCVSAPCTPETGSELARAPPRSHHLSHLEV